jgi:hypothetical protein
LKIRITKSDLSLLNNPNRATAQNQVYNINITHQPKKGVSMTTISKRTELSRLISLGLVSESQVSAWNKRLAREDAKEARVTELVAIEKQVLTLMTETPDARFKTGKLVKAIGFDTESDRVTLHGKVGRALKSLAACGEITRYNFTRNNTHAFYSLDSDIQPPVKETETETEFVTPADITSAE